MYLTKSEWALLRNMSKDICVDVSPSSPKSKSVCQLKLYNIKHIMQFSITYEALNFEYFFLTLGCLKRFLILKPASRTFWVLQGCMT